MSFVAHVFRVAVVSCDSAADAGVAADMIHDWNARHAAERACVLLPRHVSSLAPFPSEREQSHLEFEPRRVWIPDLVLGVFASGADDDVNAQVPVVEEVQKLMTTGARVRLYFRAPSWAPAAERADFARFRQQCLAAGLAAWYGSIESLRWLLAEDLAALMDSRALSDSGLTTDAQQAGFDLGNENLSPEAQELIRAAARAMHGLLLRVQETAHTLIQVDRGGYLPKIDSSHAAAWSRAVDELEALGLIEDTGTRHELYHITVRGYRAADAL